MTITITDLRNWLGSTYTSILTDTQLTAALDAATRYCSGSLAARGVGAGGNSYDSAVESWAKGQVCLILDSMGIKPGSMSNDAGSQGSEVLGTAKGWFELANAALEDAFYSGASNKRDLWVHHVRGGRGI